MIASMLWKEYREHRAVWVTLALVGVAAIVGLPWAFPPEPAWERSYREGLACTAVALAWAYGMVCGAMLLAGEAENGTQGYLDALPAARLPLWLAKVLAGGLFVLLQCGVLALLGSLKGLVEPMLVPLGVLALLFAGALGLGWGLCCSARGSSVLSSIGWAIFTQFLVLPLLQLLCMIPLAIVAMAVGGHFPEAAAVLGGAALALALPWGVSALRYTRPDRSRAFDRPGQRRLWRPSVLEPWRASLWLARRQVRGFTWGIILFCLAAGFPVASMGLVLWPAFSLLVGALCGVTVFFDEQRGPYRFLGDQRLPLTGLWLVKAGLRLGVGMLGLAALLVPSVVVLLIELIQRPRHPGDPTPLVALLFHSPMMGITIPAGLFLFMPPLYGFAIGHICGIVLRKALVAVVVSLGLSMMLLCLWVPSFLTGGLLAWQVLLVPLVLVAGARLLLRPWATDRLLSWAALARLGGVVAACVLLTVAGLWYRVAEIPDVPEPEGFRPFVASLAKLKDNEAGLAVRAGLVQLETLSKDWMGNHPQAARPLFPDQKENSANLSLENQAVRVASGGWPPGPAADHELAGWLDSVFQGDWWRRLQEARGKPPGLVEDFRLRTVSSPDQLIPSAQFAGTLLAAHGLLMQKKGDPAAFVENLDTALTLVRNLETASPILYVQIGRMIEAGQLTALKRWLEALPDGADVLRRAAEALERHRAWREPSPWDVALVEYLLALNSLDEPQPWAWQTFDRWGAGNVEGAQLIANAGRVPWEQERTRRLVRARHWGRVAIPQRVMRYLAYVTPNGRGGVMFPRDRPSRLADLEAARLFVALRRYQAEKGRPAQALGDLVPAYLPEVPADPFDGQPFRYRLSSGEEIQVGKNFPNPQPLKAAPGQGVLWSVGEDRQDDGGTCHAPGRATLPGEDRVYLVPPPAKGP
jgi:hypothetical protein